MFVEILIGIGSILLAVSAGLIVLPIRIGAAGFYRGDAYRVSGFARGWGGLCGVVCEVDATGLQWRVVLGPCTVWRPKASAPRAVESDAEGSPEGDAAEAERAEKEADAMPAAESPWRSRYAQAKQYTGYAAEARPIATRFAKRLLRVIRFRDVALDLEVGLGDPAFTGRLFGYVEAVKRVLGERVRISLTPDFVQPRFAGSGSIRLSIYLSRLLWAVLALATRGGCLAAKVWWAQREVQREEPLAADH